MERKIHEFETTDGSARSSLAEAYFLLGTHYFLALDLEKMDSAFQKAAAAAPESELACWTIPNFYFEIEDWPSAQRFYEKGQLFLKNDHQKAMVGSRLADLNLRTAEAMDEQVLKKSQKGFRRAMKIRHRLAKQNEAAFLPDLADLQLQMAVFYDTRQYLRATDFRGNLKNGWFEPNTEDQRHVFQMDLGYSLWHLNPKSKRLLRQQLSVYRRLVLRNEEKYLPKLAQMLHSLAHAYRNDWQKKKAKAALDEYFSIEKKLYETKPCSMVAAYKCMAWHALFHEPLEKAESFMEQALAAERTCFAESASPDLSKMAQTLEESATFYISENEVVVFKNYTKAESVILEAIALRRKITEPKPEDLPYQIPIDLEKLASLYENVGLFEQALVAYQEAFSIRTRLFHEYKPIEAPKWGAAVFELQNLIRACKSQFRYDLVCRAELLWATTADTLKGTSSLGHEMTISAWSDLSWDALVAHDFDLSERAARRCLALDSRQFDARCNLGHSFLLRGKVEAAKNEYAQLNGFFNQKEELFKKSIPADFELFKQIGLASPDFEVIRGWMEAEW